MRTLVLGAGGLGGYFAARLMQAGFSVDLLVRPARAQHLSEHGLVVHEQGVRSVLPVRPLQAAHLHEPGHGPWDLVLLTCKAYDLNDAIESIAPAIGPGTAILPLLNGIAHLDALAARFGASAVLGGLTLVYATVDAQGEIERGVFPFDGTTLGELDGRITPRVEAVRDALQAAGLAVTLSDDVLGAMWKKFHTFCVVATVTTLVRARAGEIAASPAGAAYVTSVMDEIAQVFAAEGHAPAAADRATLQGLFSQVDSTYGPSMLRDVELGRRTEAEHTLGDLVKRADRLGVAVPLTRAALCHLQIHEARVRRGT
jgi:2-dehydropantoate 2-reductase